MDPDFVFKGSLAHGFHISVFPLGKRRYHIGIGEHFHLPESLFDKEIRRLFPGLQVVDKHPSISVSRDVPVDEHYGDIVPERLVQDRFAACARSHDQAFDIITDDGVYEIPELLPALVRTGEKDGITSLVCDVFKITADVGIERIRDIGDKQGDGVGTAAAQ